MERSKREQEEGRDLGVRTGDCPKMHLSHRDRGDLYVLLKDLLDIKGKGLVPTD